MNWVTDCITLTTDFGTKDSYTASLKGVILSICPNIQIVDISHHIPMGDIMAASFQLLSCYRYFPAGTIHIAVVDPGVGGKRKPLAIQADEFIFIGPDNGLFAPLLLPTEKVSIRELNETKLFQSPVSPTFHGRDIFAPSAAHLAKGYPFTEVGPELDALNLGTWPSPEFSSDEIHGIIVHIDHFGNAITNIHQNALGDTVPGENLELRFSGWEGVPVNSYYEEVQQGSAMALVGSSGFYELAVNGDSAEKCLGLSVGMEIRLGAHAR
ncbi:MAG TPA: hypothetical protein EYQ50_24945 [Verrucomicrobiales bacterium]|nr:hypothetical protein [Verrucomicrobiales bacterium]HIL68292.1 hypothetical protein [Verrucomicrobiota bacterium]